MREPLFWAAAATAAATAVAASVGPGFRLDESARLARIVIEADRDLEVFFHDKARKPSAAQIRDIEKLVNLFAQEDPDSRRAARVALLKKGASAVKTLLGEVEKDETSAVNAIIVLADRGEGSALKLFREALSTKKSGEAVRLFSALALGWLGDIESVSDLRALLRENRHPDARASAALALAKLGARDALKDLRDVVKGEDSTRTRAWTILSLGILGDPAAVPFLADVARGKNESDRRAACLALGFFPGDGTLPLLRDRLAGDGEDLVRAAAAASLGRFRDDKAAMAALVSALKDRAEEVRAAAISALAAAGGPDAAETAVKWLSDAQEKEPVRRASAAALGTLKGGGQPGIAALLAGLGDGDDSIRSVSAIALAAVSDPAARTEIEKRLSQERKDFVRADFALALSSLLGKESVPLLDKHPDREEAPASVLARGLRPLFERGGAIGVEAVARLLRGAALREGVGADQDFHRAVNRELLRAFALLDRNFDVIRARETTRSQSPPPKPHQDLRFWFEDRPYVGGE